MKERQLIGLLSPKTKDKNIGKSLWSISTLIGMSKRINNFSYDIDSPSLFIKIFITSKSCSVHFWKEFLIDLFCFFCKEIQHHVVRIRQIVLLVRLNCFEINDWAVLLFS